MKRLVSLVFCLLLSAPALSAPQTATDWYDAGVREFYRRHAEPAVSSLRQAVQLDARSPMSHLFLSRALMADGHADEAVAQSVAALDEVDLASDPDGYLVRAWAAHMRSVKDPHEGVRGEAEAHNLVDQGIAVYPDNAELYILAGDLAPTPLQAAPYYLAALQLNPSHPLARHWSVAQPPLADADPSQYGGVTVPASGMKLYPGLGKVHHVVSTRNPQAQAYFDQGLCCLYGYVDPAARQSFEAAIQLDPHLAMAWWGLSFCAPPQPSARRVAERALFLARHYGTLEEQRYCSARVLDLRPGQQQQALDALCGAIVASPQDVGLWVWRASWQGFAGEEDDRKSLHGLPFALAACRVQPDHPSANHELVHTYEAIDRPVLGWKYSWGFRRSAPNLPHAQHMQAHLAMRLGRWKDALNCTRESIRLSRAGFPELDHDHHLDIYMWALAHEGCFQEAMKVAQPKGQDDSWARLLRLKLDDARLTTWAKGRRASPGDGWYFGALADLDRGRWQEAKDELEHFPARDKLWYGADTSLWKDEVNGRILYASGHRDEGLSKLHDLAVWSDGLQESHRWGQGAYYDELWGEAALQSGHLDEAQEALGEAIAHEHGSIVAALGLQVLWEMRHNPTQSAAFATRAREIWSQADPGALDRLLERVRQVAAGRASIF